MASFKEVGQFKQPSFVIPDNLRQGGVDLERGFSVRPEGFRLRPLNEQNTTSEVSAHDIVPIKLHPGELKNVELPRVQDINLGTELEFMVLDGQTGHPVSLYANDEVY